MALKLNPYHIKENEWNIKLIESFDEYDAKELATESVTIKGHNLYFVDFPGYFGYSCLVFLNGGYLYHANDYQLHHAHKTKEELRQWYLETMKNKLFTEKEFSVVTSYDDYRHKANYLTNYYGMQKPYISIFFIGTDKERENRRKKTEKMVFDPVNFAYYDPKEKEFVLRHIQLKANLEKAKEALADDFDYWVEAFQTEMFNHEYGINWDGDREVLAALGVKTLTPIQASAYQEAKRIYYKNSNL